MGRYHNKVRLNLLCDGRDLALNVYALAKNHETPGILFPDPVTKVEQSKFHQCAVLFALSITMRPAHIGKRVRRLINVNQEEVSAVLLRQTNGRVDSFYRVRGWINWYDYPVELDRIPGKE